ncbi:hypothetical protein OAP76_07180 [Alphaproteobacteria bacterium]|nr:hypothetical protein [Alphaproteobacteria bacterium]
MSKLFEEAWRIAKKENKNANDYKRIKEISRLIPESEDYEMAWILEGLFQDIPDIIKREGNDKFLEDEDR